MKAIILAAGYGTRLRPLTFVRPKALVPVMGTTVLEFWINELWSAGFDSVVVNAFHLADELIRAVEGREWPIPVSIARESTLLGTAGGIRNALDFFQGEPFAVLNGDTICKAPLRKLYRSHVDSGAEATLLIHDCAPFNNVAVASDGSIRGFGPEALAIRSEVRPARLLAFTGIHFVNPSLLEHLPTGVPGEIVPVYRRLIERGCAPRAVVTSGLFWREMGAVESYRALHGELCRLENGMLTPIPTGAKLVVHAAAKVEKGFDPHGFVVVGAGSTISEDVRLEDTIVWDGARIDAGSSLKNCIVTDGCEVSGDHFDEIIVKTGERAVERR